MTRRAKGKPFHVILSPDDMRKLNAAAKRARCSKAEVLRALVGMLGEVERRMSREEMLAMLADPLPVKRSPIPPIVAGSIWQLDQAHKSAMKAARL